VARVKLAAFSRERPARWRTQLMSGPAAVV
jgi:hypothetical protein